MSIAILSSNTCDWHLFIIILVSNEVSLSLDSLTIRLEWLSSLKFVSLGHVKIIIVGVMVWVFVNIRVPSDEGVV